MFATLLKRDSDTVFSSEFCEIFKNTFFDRAPPVPASVYQDSFLKSKSVAQLNSKQCWPMNLFKRSTSGFLLKKVKRKSILLIVYYFVFSKI